MQNLSQLLSQISLHLFGNLGPDDSEYIARDGSEGVMYPVADLGHTHELELARLLHGDGQAELEGLLDGKGLGIDQPGKGLHFRRKILTHGRHPKFLSPYGQHSP